MSANRESNETVAMPEPGEEHSPTPARDLLAAAVGPELAQRLLFALGGTSSALPGWGPPARVGRVDD